jgi:N4-gp56 family major capsid protein
MAYAPASNTTATPSLTHLATVYYERKSLDQLTKVFRFRQACEPDILPLRVGKTVQFYRYSLLAANTTPATEGAVGTGIPLSTTTISAAVSEYADYVTISNLLEQTAIDPIVENASFNLGYRAGLTVDTIVRTEFDANVSSVQLQTQGAALGAIDFRKAAAIMEGSDIRPFDSSTFGEGSFYAIAHPYVLFDLMSDNTAGGFIDVMRYADPQAVLNNEAGKIGACRIMKSTNVGTTGSVPSQKRYVYVVGKGAVGAIDLAGTGPTMVDDPQKQSFKINVIKGGPQIADPEGMIGSAVSYRFVFVAKTLDTTTYRYRILLAQTSLNI